MATCTTWCARQWAAAHSGTEAGDRWLVAGSVATNESGFLRYDLRREIMPQTRDALDAARRLGDRHSEGSFAPGNKNQ